MAKSEQEIRKELPDSIYSKNLSGYFIEKFREKRDGVEMDPISPSLPYESKRPADPENPRIVLRAVGIHSESKMKDKNLIPYLSHLLSYPQAYEIHSLRMDVVPHDKWKTALKVSTDLEVFLTPKQWLGESQRKKIDSQELNQKASQKRDVANMRPQDAFFSFEESTKGSSKSSSQSNPSAFARGGSSTAQLQALRKRMEPNESGGKKGGVGSNLPKPKPVGPPAFPIKVTQIIGQSIVVNGEVYETGDLVGPDWTFYRWDRAKKTVYFKAGKHIKKWVMP